ncbi:hypothetical protein [Kitasatospora sp. NPDC001261]|uniref:hypothetical protein n=1 Tax=unclassified Kitasatospora TaxID=2633591 RepID=UPI0036B6347E
MSKVADLQKAQQSITHPGSGFFIGAAILGAIGKALAVAGLITMRRRVREEGS